MKVVVTFKDSMEEYIGSVQIPPKDMELTDEEIKERLKGQQFEIFDFDDRLRPMFEWLKHVKFTNITSLAESVREVIDSFRDTENNLDSFRSYIEREREDAKKREHKAIEWISVKDRLPEHKKDVLCKLAHIDDPLVNRIVLSHYNYEDFLSKDIEWLCEMQIGTCEYKVIEWKEIY